MRLLATTPEANLSRLPIAFDLRALSVQEGLRAALSVAIIVAADQWVHWPPLLEAAIGALLTCLGDSGGPIRRRLPALAAFAALGMALTAGFALLRGQGLLVVIPLAGFGIFALSLARIWGQSAMQVGNLLVVVLVLATDVPRSWHDAGLIALIFGAGSLWAVLLTMVIWRIHPFRPARQAVSDAYRSTARLAADMLALVQAQASPAEWEAHARGHRRAVRETIERARTAVQDTIRVRGQASARAMQGLLRIETIDQIFGALIALADVLEFDRDPAVQDGAIRLLRLLRPVLRVISAAIRADDPGHGQARSVERLARLGPALDRIAAAGATPKLAGLTDAIVERLRVVVNLTAPKDFVPGSLPDAAAPGTWRQIVLGPLRANLSWKSAAFRHALRAAVVGAPALAFTLTLKGNYQHWLIITLVLTMQPFYALTWQRALERIGGTVLGGVLAAVIALVCTTPLQIAAALFPLAVLAFTIRAVNFGAFISLLTPLVVLLTEFSRPGTGELLIALYRAAYTAAGGLLAVAGCLLLWPSWEPDRLKRELRLAIEAHAAFARAEMDALLGEGTQEAVDRARRGAGLASNNLEASISRALNEPRRSEGAAVQSAMVTDAALRRMAGRLSALQLDPHHADGVAPQALLAWRDWISAGLQALAAGEKVPAPRPAGAAPDALQRIARQIEMLDTARLGVSA